MLKGNIAAYSEEILMESKQIRLDHIQLDDILMLFVLLLS